MAEVKNVIICHGYGADPMSNWFDWLRRELEGLDVKVPDFGQDQTPDYGKWSTKLEEVLQGLNPGETVLVGHSLGGALVSRYLSQYEGEPFLKAFLVAAPYENIGWEVLDVFFDGSKLDASAKDKAKKFYILASDNDPYIPLDHADKFKELLGGEVIVENGLEHIWQSEYERLIHLIMSANV